MSRRDFGFGMGTAKVADDSGVEESAPVFSSVSVPDNDNAQFEPNEISFFGKHT